MKLHYEITQSEDMADNPLEWTTPEERGAWFVMSHKRYDLPNELEVDFESYDSWYELAEGEAKTGQVYKFVRWYEHSGIAVSLRDDASIQEWDAGIVGVIIGNSEHDIQTAFSEWQAYVEGDIWDIAILDEDGEYIDGCGQYYGHEYAEQEAQAMLKYAQEQADKQEKLHKQAQKEIAQARTLAKKHGYILASEVTA